VKIADLKVEPKVEILENGNCDAKHQHIDEDKVGEQGFTPFDSQALTWQRGRS